MARRPDYTLKALDTRSTTTAKKRGNDIGAGWVNTDGSISFKLDVGVCLRWDDEISIRAFPPFDTSKGRDDHRAVDIGEPPPTDPDEPLPDDPGSPDEEG